jgi:hypothetical protein
MGKRELQVINEESENTSRSSGYDLMPDFNKFTLDSSDLK